MRHLSSDVVGEEKSRRLFLLKVVLVGLLILSIVAAVMECLVLVDDFVNMFWLIFTAVLLWFLYLLAIKKWLLFPSLVIIGILSLISFRLVYCFGTQLPQSLILLALTIVMSGVLIGSYFSLVLVFIDGFFLLLIDFLQLKGMIGYQSWDTSPSYGSVLVAIFTLLVIAIISWLSNKEIEKALKRARASEKELKKERDNLEIEVEKRTKELRKKQLEKIVDLYKFADFGRLTAGLFHDISSPLTQVSLNLSNLKYQTKNLSPELNKLDPIVKRAIDGTEQMQRLLISVRKQIQQQETKTVYRPWNEVQEVIENFEYKAKDLNVAIRSNGDEKIETFGNSMRFYQLVSNLISNALDSYHEYDKKGKKEIFVELKQIDKWIEFTVKDYGCGIDKKIIERIFDPLFTTKDLDRGTGVGLYVSKTIVEKEFGGEIRVKSKLNEGSLFIIRFPIKKNNEKSN